MRASDGSRLLPRAFALLLLALPLFAGCVHYRRPEQRPPFKKLSPPIAYEMMRDSPEMLILDLRPPQEYNGETGHLRRAANIPLERLAYRLLEISPFREDTVLVYCRADDCGEKGMAVLIASGFENAVLMDGGIDAWIREGFKTVLPSETVDRARQPADGKGPVMPRRPGESEVAPKKEVPVEPPPPGAGLPRRDNSAKNE
jgi:rhodanese-related sulfurtransferase